ncbi:rod shape-determining protein MreD [bacterium]|nr:rod shape-determining protein MreD [bacterium]
MIRTWIGSLWLHRLIFLAVVVVITFVRLLPLDTSAGHLPGPDILLCLILAWMVRRPEYLSAPLIAAVVLAEDILLMRPPGLWTAVVLMGAEFLRARSALTRELSFGVEWLLVSGVMVAMFLVNRLVMALAFLPQPILGYALVQMVWSVLAYPAVVAFSRYGLDLHKPATGEIDAYGRKM